MDGQKARDLEAVRSDVQELLRGAVNGGQRRRAKLGAISSLLDHLKLDHCFSVFLRAHFGVSDVTDLDDQSVDQAHAFVLSVARAVYGDRFLEPG